VIQTREPLKASQVLRIAVGKPLTKIKLLFLLASFVSFALSMSLWFSGHEQQGIFVGIWVPSIHSLGALLLAGERGDLK